MARYHGRHRVDLGGGVNGRWPVPTGGRFDPLSATQTLSDGHPRVIRSAVEFERPRETLGTSPGSLIHSPDETRDGPMNRSSRRPCPRSIQLPVMEMQGYCCAYCKLPFGCVLCYHGRYRLTVVNWDHVLPYAYIGRNPDYNWAAACMVCNQLKHSLVFDSVRAIGEYMAAQWEARGIWCVWQPPVSSEENGTRWAIAYASWLASNCDLDVVDEVG